MGGYAQVGNDVAQDADKGNGTGKIFIPNLHLCMHRAWFPRVIDKKKFEEFKTRFYKLQGWDTTTGYPTGSTLKSLGLAHVADELAANGKLGKKT